MPAASPLHGPLRFTVLPEHGETILRLIGCRTIDWCDVAGEVRRSPGLMCALLLAMPLQGRRLENDLDDVLVERLQIIGSALLRTWLMQLLWTQPQPGPADYHSHAKSQLVAECALHLALQTAYPHPDEASLVGHWHALDTLLASPASAPGSHVVQNAAAAHTSASPRNLIASLMLRCGASLPMVDALKFHGALEEQLQDAHPLARLVWSAESLASENWESRLTHVARVTGLPAVTLVSLRTDAAFIAAGGEGAENTRHQARFPSEISPAATDGLAAASRRDLIDETLRRTALSGWLRSAFADLTEDRIGTRLMHACQLLCGIPAPLVVMADEHDHLRALEMGSRSAIVSHFNELAQRRDNPTSIIARALRTDTPSSRVDQGVGPGRDVCDWQVAQWLGTTGMICLPLTLGDSQAVAVIGVDGDITADNDVCQLVAGLTAGAVEHWLNLDRQKQLRLRTDADIEARYRDHARRIVHEANNPLTVINSYLSVMPTRHPEAEGLDEELKVLRAELERLGILFKQVAHPPDTAAEAACCRVDELLQDMNSLYGEPLFTQRGIQFDLRSSQALPPAALPASALKQVLLNLFRNASEALQPGKRFSVVVPGQLIVNGNRCIEIRIIDNGPGLPAARLSQLFSPQPSGKGGDHQGLGLSIVNDILAKWGGSMLCRSQPGSGTSFQLLVPVAE